MEEDETFGLGGAPNEDSRESLWNGLKRVREDHGPRACYTNRDMISLRWISFGGTRGVIGRLLRKSMGILSL